MATVGDLWRELLPSAAAATPVESAGTGRDIAWVRMLRARVPALDAVERGDLVIAPLAIASSVASGPADSDALVAAIDGAGGSAILAVGEPGDDALGPLAEAAAHRGIPVLLVGGADPFSLERSIIGWLVNRRAEVDRQAALLERQLETLALAGTDLAGLVGAFGAALGRAAVLEGRRGSATAVHVPPGSPGAAAAASRYLSSGGGVALRVALPTAGNGRSAGRGAGTGAHASRGSIVILGDDAPTELERTVTDRVAALFALELARNAEVQRARDTARRADSLPGDGPPWVVIVARQAQRPGADRGDPPEAIRAELRLLAPARRLALRGDADSLELRLVAATDAADPLGTDLARRVAGLLGRTVAVSRVFTDPKGRPVAEAEARQTLEAAESANGQPANALEGAGADAAGSTADRAGRMAASRARVVRADRQPAYRLLGNLHNLPDGPRLARALLEPLLAGRPGDVRSRLATLQAVVDHPGLAEAAARLGVHRNTIAYRVRRIEALGGWDLQDAELRLALAVALRFVHDAQG